MRKLALLGVLLSAGCSGALSPRPIPPEATHTDTRVNGTLRLELTDYPTPPGIMFALPSVTGGDGHLVVENTRYGSLCLFAVDGRAETTDHTIALHVSFEQRLSVCTQEIRALKYSATITEPAGVYDVLVIHEENAAADTLVRRTVTVR